MKNLRLENPRPTIFWSRGLVGRPTRRTQATSLSLESESNLGTTFERHWVQGFSKWRHLVVVLAAKERNRSDAILDSLPINYLHT